MQVEGVVRPRDLIRDDEYGKFQIGPESGTMSTTVRPQAIRGACGDFA
jgi:hypothetical protein